MKFLEIVSGHPSPPSARASSRNRRRGLPGNGLAAGKQGTAASASADDRTIRDAVTAELEGKGWVTHGGLNVVVSDSVVEFWGWVESDQERKARRIAAESVEGVRAVEDPLGSVAPWVWGT